MTFHQRNARLTNGHRKSEHPRMNDRRKKSVRFLTNGMALNANWVVTPDNFLIFLTNCLSSNSMTALTTSVAGEHRLISTKMTESLCVLRMLF